MLQVLLWRERRKEFWNEFSSTHPGTGLQHHFTHSSSRKYRPTKVEFITLFHVFMKNEIETTSLWSVGNDGRRRKTVIDINLCHKVHLMQAGVRDLVWLLDRCCELLLGELYSLMVKISLSCEKHLCSLLLCRPGVLFQAVTAQLRWNLFPWLLWYAALALAGSQLCRGGRPPNPTSVNSSIKSWLSDVQVQAFSQSWAQRWFGHVQCLTGTGGGQDRYALHKQGLRTRSSGIHKKKKFS